MGISKGCLAAAGAVVLLAPLRLFAADATAPAGELEEITVTAQKRSESQQNVPLSMTTFSSVALQEKSVNTFFDYATKVPNLAFAPTGDGVGTARTVSIRGVSGNNVTSFYIDDTPLPDSIDPRVLDIDHIEVLRGPQGTLYGARSMGGLVRIVTKEPDINNFSATVHGGASDTARTDQPNYTGDGVVNIPLIQDHAALRLSAFYDEEAGYFKRSYCSNPAAAMAGTCTPLATTGITTVDNVGAIDTYGGAASLTLKINDALTITPRIMQQQADYNGFPMSDYTTDTANGVGYPVPTPQNGAPTPSKMVPTNFTQARWFNVPEGGSDKWTLSSIGVHWKTGIGELVSSTSYFSRKVFETEDESDFVYTAITAGAGGEPQPSSISEEKDYQEFVQEVRFVSALDGPVQFVGGGFYSDTHGRLPFAAYYPGATAPGLDQTLIGGPGELTPGYPNLIFAQDFHTDIKEPAVFGEVSYQPIDPLKLTAGLRWYQVKTSSEGYEMGLAAGGGPATVSPPDTEKESGVNPKFEADYHLTPDQMVYVNVAKGFRPGGIVPIVPPGEPGTSTDCVAALKAGRSQYHHLADTKLSIRFLVELRTRDENGMVGSPLVGGCGRVLHQVEQYSARDPAVLRLPIHGECRRRGEQGRRTGNPRAADGPPRIVAGSGLSGRENHSNRPRVAAGSRFAHLSGTGLDRQWRGVVHHSIDQRLENDQRRRLFLHRQKFQRQQRSQRSAAAAIVQADQCPPRVRS